MNKEDSMLIADYMSLDFDKDANLYFYTDKKGEPCIFHFDLNDAGPCVERMKDMT